MSTCFPETAMCNIVRFRALALGVCTFHKARWRQRRYLSQYSSCCCSYLLLVLAYAQYINAYLLYVAVVYSFVVSAIVAIYAHLKIVCDLLKRQW